MNSLTEDRDEMDTTTEARWVARARRARGIRPHQPATWAVYEEQGDDRDMKFVSRSPGDAVAIATSYATGGRRQGTGRWITEVFGDGDPPRIVRVLPFVDGEDDDDE